MIDVTIAMAISGARRILEKLRLWKKKTNFKQGGKVKIKFIWVNKIKKTDILGLFAAEIQSEHVSASKMEKWYGENGPFDFKSNSFIFFSNICFSNLKCHFEH